MSDNLIIRQQIFDSQNDYKALAGLSNYAYPEELITVNGLKLADAARPAKMICERWFAEQNGLIVGVGSFEHWATYYHPHKYLLQIIVAPEFQRQGIGNALSNHVIQQLEKRQPQFAQIWIRENRQASIEFAKKRGFSKVKLKWNMRLDLKKWSADSFAKQVAEIHESGIAIKPLSAIRSDFEHQRKLYDLYVMTINSIEGAEEAVVPDFDDFLEQINQSSDELFFVAIHNNSYVGMWQLENESVGTLFGGIMAVEKSYRRRGAALALAVHGIARAQSFQYKNLTVHTDEHNQAILALTEKMGFTHLPAQIIFGKQFER